MGRISIIFLLFAIAYSCGVKYDPRQPYVAFKKRGLYGLIDTKTKQVIIPADYMFLDPYTGSGYYPYKSKEAFYIATDKKENGFLYDTNGKVLHTFTKNERLDHIFIYNRKVYALNRTPEPDDPFLIGRTDNIKLFRVRPKQDAPILTGTAMTRLGDKNLVFFNGHKTGFFDLNTEKELVIENYHNSVFGYVYLPTKNEVWLRKSFDAEAFYDTVIDSTLAIYPNPKRNVTAVYKDYLMVKTEKGFEIHDFKGNASPFAYPYLTTQHVNDDPFHPERKKIADSLFVFSSDKSGLKKGIVDISGKIILPDEFEKIYIQFPILYGVDNPKLSAYLKENRLNNLRFFTYQAESKTTAIFNEDGLEIFRLNDVNGFCSSWDYDVFAEKPTLKVRCGNSINVYDLRTKNLIRTETIRD